MVVRVHVNQILVLDIDIRTEQPYLALTDYFGTLPLCATFVTGHARIFERPSSLVCLAVSPYRRAKIVASHQRLVNDVLFAKRKKD